MVIKLEKKHVLKKRKSADSNKELEISLTPTGWDAFAAHQKFHERHLQTLTTRLSEFTAPQIAMTGAILSVIESVVDERMEELFTTKEHPNSTGAKL